jgi:hypothetical protein
MQSLHSADLGAVLTFDIKVEVVRTQRTCAVEKVMSCYLHGGTGSSLGSSPLVLWTAAYVAVNIGRQKPATGVAGIGSQCSANRIAAGRVRVHIGISPKANTRASIDRYV